LIKVREKISIKFTHIETNNLNIKGNHENNKIHIQTQFDMSLGNITGKK